MGLDRAKGKQSVGHSGTPQIHLDKKKKRSSNRKRNPSTLSSQDNPTDWPGRRRWNVSCCCFLVQLDAQTRWRPPTFGQRRCDWTKLGGGLCAVHRLLVLPDELKKKKVKFSEREIHPKRWSNSKLYLVVG